jgi:uncharacterized protein DUF3106
VNRGVTLVLFLATAALCAAQQSSIDPQKLEMIRKMAPEERAKLKARLEEIKKLPVEERERLKQNLDKIKAMPVEEVKKLREKDSRLAPEEHKAYAEMAQGFFHWARRNGYAEGFPRGVFFAWLKRERAEKMQEIRDMDPGLPGASPGTASPRVDAFMKLFYEFKDVTLGRTEQHLQKHKCAPAETIHQLRDASPREYWPLWAEVQKNCGARKANPGPVPPRPLDAPRK